MKLLSRTVLVTQLLLLCAAGCANYHYRFRTEVQLSGEAKRTVLFWVGSERPPLQDLPARGRGDQQAGMRLWGEHVLLPDAAGFEEYVVDSRCFYAVTRPVAALQPDFRFVVSGERLEGRNDPRVFVRDYALVTSVNYVETFHDLHTKVEYERNADQLIEELADSAVSVLQEKFGTEYDTTRLREYVKRDLIPFLQQWKFTLVRYLISHRAAVAFPDLAATITPCPEELDMTYELTRLGLLDDLDSLTCVLARGKLQDHLVARLRGMIVRKEDGESIDGDTLRQYLFGEDGFEAGLKGRLEKQYGSFDNFCKEARGLFDSLSFYTNLLNDQHSFEVIVLAPGEVAYALPVPTSITTDNSTGLKEVTWCFSEGDFFPEGVRLLLVAMVPNVEQQRRVAGQAILTRVDDMETYCALFKRLDDDMRITFLKALAACEEVGSLDPLYDLAHTRRDGDDPLRRICKLLTELAEREDLGEKQ